MDVPKVIRAEMPSTFSLPEDRELQRSSESDFGLEDVEAMIVILVDVRLTRLTVTGYL